MSGLTVDPEFRSHIPPLTEEERGQLEANLLAEGCRDPLVLWGDVLVDGHNRLDICTTHGLSFETVQRDFTDREAVIDWIERNQLGRRNLSPEARKLLIGNVYNRRKKGHGGDRKSKGQIGPLIDTADEVASEFAASPRTVKRAGAAAAAVADTPLAGAVTGGKAKLNDAATVARETTPEEQVEIVAHGEAAILAAAKEIRAKKAAKQREARLEKIAEISAGNTELNTDTRYPIIYADPPWRYENPPIGSSSRAIENHYPTMTLDEICALRVADLAAPDAMLYLWATAPKLEECFEVIRAWGFEYRTHMVWDKEKIGMGYHARNQHELLLICKRGSIPPPAPGTQPASVYRESRTAHSAKPHFFYEMIEGAYPDLPKIELFCRTPRDGWAAWGNQSEAAA